VTERHSYNLYLNVSPSKIDDLLFICSDPPLSIMETE
jgi:hypothetical protein